MTRRQRWIALALIPIASALAASAERPKPSVAQLAWLAGCWAYVGAEAGSGEAWMPPAGGQLMGSARRVRGGRVVSWEFQRIVEEDAGLAFYASPSGAPAVRFALESLTANHVAFENLENDFPQRVIYRLERGGSIRARIEGAKEAPARAIDFPMKRTSCGRASKR